ncbi:MAG: hypothetical protein M3Q70_03765 [bacterium]|nr:hypothetical protein [bacterium]
MKNKHPDIPITNELTMFNHVLQQGRTIGSLPQALLREGSKPSKDYLPSQDGFYFHPDSPLEIAKTPKRISFMGTPTRAVGREDSRNNVFFGDLTLHSYRGRRHEHGVPVAVKPFLGLEKEDFLVRELQAIHDIGRIGLNGVKPIGVVKSGDNSFMVSLFEQEHITLDSIDWQRISPEVRQRTIRRGLLSLLELQTNDRVHGDADPRNLTIQPNLLGTWHVDLEHSTRAEDPAKLLVGLKRDLLDFYTGLCKLEQKRPTIKDMVNDILFPYSELTTIMTADSEGARKILTLLPLLHKELDREFAGEPVSQAERQYLISTLA